MTKLTIQKLQEMENKELENSLHSEFQEPPKMINDNSKIEAVIKEPLKQPKKVSKLLLIKLIIVKTFKVCRSIYRGLQIFILGKQIRKVLN